MPDSVHRPAGQAEQFARQLRVGIGESVSGPCRGSYGSPRKTRRPRVAHYLRQGFGWGVKISHGLDGVVMIEALFGANSSGMARHHSDRIQERFQATENSPDSSRSWGRAKFEMPFQESQGSQRPEHQSDNSQDYRGHCGRGHGRARFGDAVGSAVFADRARMQRHAEFRTEMHEIRSGVRDLMGKVEGGVLTPEQQQTFDGFVTEIVELRESYDFKHWRSTDADVISDRILHRFGVDPAPCGCTETPDPNVAAQSLPVVETTIPTNEGISTSETSSVEQVDVVDSGSVSETETNEELTAMAERLAGVIADASALMDELLEALGA